jgi:hypothetical protein
VICEKNHKFLAFSLVEVMVAVGLLGVIIVGLLAMFYQTQRAFRVGMTQADVLEKGRATMELIARELQECSASIDAPVTNIQIAVPSGYMPPTIALPGGFNTNAILQNISFLRRVNDDWVGQAYQVTNALTGLGTLCRLLLVTNRTMLGPLADTIHNARIGDVTNVVADGIVHLRVLPLDGLGLRMTNSISVTTPDPFNYLFHSNALPSYFEIELAVLEPRSVEQFRARYATDSAKALSYLQNQAGRIHFFKQRVPVRGGPAYFAVTNVP